MIVIGWFDECDKARDKVEQKIDEVDPEQLLFLGKSVKKEDSVGH